MLPHTPCYQLAVLTAEIENGYHFSAHKLVARRSYLVARITNHVFSSLVFKRFTGKVVRRFFCYLYIVRMRLTNRS